MELGGSLDREAGDSRSDVLCSAGSGDSPNPGGPRPTPPLRSARSSRTPPNYRAMLANVENIFQQQGDTSVIWTMTYMDYDQWACPRDVVFYVTDFINCIHRFHS